MTDHREHASGYRVNHRFSRAACAIRAPEPIIVAENHRM
jgi:hypothetical protein